MQSPRELKKNDALTTRAVAGPSGALLLSAYTSLSTSLYLSSLSLSTSLSLARPMQSALRRRRLHNKHQRQQRFSTPRLWGNLQRIH